MSDLPAMARNLAHVIGTEARGRLTEEHVADAFQRGALWALARATHALAITLAATGPDPDGLRPGIERAQRAIVVTAEKMREAVASEGAAWPRR